MPVGQLEEIPIDLGYVCEADDRDGPYGYCCYPAAYYDPEAEESQPM